MPPESKILKGYLGALHRRIAHLFLAVLDLAPDRRIRRDESSRDAAIDKRLCSEGDVVVVEKPAAVARNADAKAALASTFSRNRCHRLIDRSRLALGIRYQMTRRTVRSVASQAGLAGEGEQAFEVIGVHLMIADATVLRAPNRARTGRRCRVKKSSHPSLRSRPK